MKTKFYVGCNWADESAAFIVELTESEYKAVTKFIEAQNNIVSGGHWCGSVSISDKGYATEEQARLAAPNYI